MECMAKITKTKWKFNDINTYRFLGGGINVWQTQQKQQQQNVCGIYLYCFLLLQS